MLALYRPVLVQDTRIFDSFCFTIELYYNYMEPVDMFDDYKRLVEPKKEVAFWRFWPRLIVQDHMVLDH